MDNNKIIKAWLYTGLLLVTLMIIIGGITRITNSGLSMVEWRLISDIIPPSNEAQWINMFEKYKQFPEYQKINYNMTLKEFKFIFFWEYIHRLLGRFIGIVFFLPFVFFWTKKWLNKKLKIQLTLLFFLGGIEAFLGWFMVKSGLEDIPHVSHFRLAVHLFTACLIIAYIYWVILNIEKPKKTYHRKINTLIKYFSIILMLQIIYGAFVAGTDAGHLVSKTNNLKTVFGYFNPEIMRNFNFSTNPYNLQLIHRLTAWVLVLSSIVILIQSRGTIYYKSALKLNTLIIMQTILGITTILTNVSPYFASFHQFVAILILLNTVQIIYISSSNSQ